MTCRDVQDRIEEIAAEERTGDDIRAHIEGCLACAAALARARAVERALALRAAPAAPANFTSAVSARIRRERWQAEQHVDRLFNVAVLVGVVLVTAGVVALMNLGGLVAALGTGIALLKSAGSSAAADAVPAVSTYLLSAALLATTMFVWWWAERRWSI